jgi:hypothetical protein
MATTVIQVFGGDEDSILVTEIKSDFPTVQTEEKATPPARPLLPEPELVPVLLDI